MEKYLGVKLIEAEPMTADVSLLMSDFRSPARQGQGDGYKVVYEDGYTSWSPKDVFEKAYRKIKTFDGLICVGGKPDHQLRVYNEVAELADKASKLESFIEGGFGTHPISIDEQIRLKQQLMAMQYYLTILVERIENF